MHLTDAGRALAQSVTEALQDMRRTTERQGQLEQQLLRSKRRDLNTSVVDKLKKESSYEISI